jgi:Ni,Fe-hydrogenase III large subunit
MPRKPKAAAVAPAAEVPAETPPTAEQLRAALPELRRLRDLAMVTGMTCKDETTHWYFMAGSFYRLIRDVEDVLAARAARLAKEVGKP